MGEVTTHPARQGGNSTISGSRNAPDCGGKTMRKPEHLWLWGGSTIQPRKLATLLKRGPHQRARGAAMLGLYFEELDSRATPDSTPKTHGSMAAARFTSSGARKQVARTVHVHVHVCVCVYVCIHAQTHSCMHECIPACKHNSLPKARS